MVQCFFRGFRFNRLNSIVRPTFFHCFLVFPIIYESSFSHSWRNWYYLHKSAREAYKSYLQAYASHQHKSIFNVNALDLRRVAPAFGFVVPPRVNLSIYCLIRVNLVFWAKKKDPHRDLELFLCPILVIRRKSIFLDCITELTNISSLCFY